MYNRYLLFDFFLLKNGGRFSYEQKKFSKYKIMKFIFVLCKLLFYLFTF